MFLVQHFGSFGSNQYGHGGGVERIRLHINRIDFHILQPLQGVSKKSTDFCFANFLASETSWKLVLYIFQQPRHCRIQKLPYFYSRIKIGIAIDKNVVRIPHLKRWVLRFQPIWWLTFVFTFSRLPRHFKKSFILFSTALGVKNRKITRFLF